MTVRVAAGSSTHVDDPAARRAEVETKLERVRAWLEASELEGLLLSAQANFAWITAGGRSHISIGEAGGVASVLVTHDRAFLLTTNIEVRRLIEEEVEGLPLDPVDRRWYTPGDERAAIAEICDPSRTVSDLESAGLALAAPGFVELRRVLLPSEQARYRALGRDVAEALETAAREAQPGELELEVAGRIAFECARRDILPLVNLVATDERIARHRHPLPAATPVGKTLLVALTGRRYGLHASLTRMVSFGAPDDELEARHRAVTRVDAAVIAASAPGTSLGDVMAVGMDRYAAEGFPREWELHHQGGLTGYAGREVFATPGEPYRLRADQALAWNPSITRVKSEDTILVTAGGFEILTRSSWPMRGVEVGDTVVERPSILLR